MPQHCALRELKPNAGKKGREGPTEREPHLPHQLIGRFKTVSARERAGQPPTKVRRNGELLSSANKFVKHTEN